MTFLARPSVARSAPITAPGRAGLRAEYLVGLPGANVVLIVLTQSVEEVLVR